jgi:hypothetical protein
MLMAHLLAPPLKRPDDGTTEIQCHSHQTNDRPNSSDSGVLTHLAREDCYDEPKHKQAEAPPTYQ